MNAADIVIVGGGAAGLATALFTARRNTARSILVLDGAPKLGAKILVAGGGRCNVTNQHVSAADFNGGNRNLIRRVLHALPVPATIAFFRGIGVPLHEEENGKLFPDSNSGRTVLAALLAEVTRLGVRIRTRQRVQAITPTAEGFHIDTASDVFAARRVVLATGGCALPKSGSDGAGYAFAQRLGHTVVPPTPALSPLVLAGDVHTGLSGVSQPVELIVQTPARAVRTTGMLLWTHFGISGPATLDVSRHWLRARLEHPSVRLSADFLADNAEASRAAADATSRPTAAHRAEQSLLAACAAAPRSRLHTVLANRMPARVVDALLPRIGLSGSLIAGQLSRRNRAALAGSLSDWPLPVSGDRGFSHAEATAGGVPLDEIDTATMASRRYPGCYLVGEILDVDGRLGGFNFQWAWASAAAAAVGLAR